VPANTINVQVRIKEKDSTATFYDYLHETVIQQPIPADTPKLLWIFLPQDKLLTKGRTFTIFIDSGGKIDESDENNNESATKHGATPSMDFKFKEEIYFHLGQPDSQAGGPGKSLKVKKSQLTTCLTGMCARITARVQKDPATFKIEARVKVKNITTGFEDDGTFDMDAGQATKDILLDIPLQDGLNTVRFELDWENRVYELDENNNVLEVPVNLIVEK